MALRLDDVKAVLAAAGLDAWQAVETRARSTERYTVFTRDEALRQVDTTRISVTVHVHHSLDGKPTLGESGFTLGNDADERELRAQLEGALERARLVHNQRYTLPASAPVGPPVENTDPGVVESAPALVDGLVGKLREAVAGHAGMELSSSEVFASYENQRVVNSRGLDVTRTSTDVMMEYVMLAGKAGSDEVEIYQSPRRRLAHLLDLKGDVERYVRYTQDGLTAGLPPGGTFDVVFGEEALDSLFDFFVGQSQASALFEGWARYKPGQPVVQDPLGDRLTVWSDPTLPGGMRTMQTDASGTPCVRTLLVEDNVFRGFVATQKYAELTGMPVTGPMGNVVVKPGTRSYAQLCTGPRPTLELLRFSQLMPNAVSGAFSGEVRTGYVHDNGKRTPIKGGSVTGMILEAFRRAQFSRETTMRQAYQGPAGVRLEGLTITGA